MLSFSSHDKSIFNFISHFKQTRTKVSVEFGGKSSQNRTVKTRFRGRRPTTSAPDTNIAQSSSDSASYTFDSERKPSIQRSNLFNKTRDSGAHVKATTEKV